MPPFGAHYTHFLAHKHAYTIWACWRAWYRRIDVFAIEVRGTKRLHVQRIIPKYSTRVVELRRLLTAAKSASVERYERRWLATTPRTLRLIVAEWDGVPPGATRREIDGLVHIVRDDFGVPHRRVAVKVGIGRRGRQHQSWRGMGGAHVSLMPLQTESHADNRTRLAATRGDPGCRAQGAQGG